jgi:tetratricopeptide (TPR) repeat protein
VRLDERDYQVWGNLGDAYYWAPGKRAQAAGGYRKALALAEERLRVNPRDATVLGYTAYYHAMLNERRKALTRCQQALAVAPGDPELQFNIALAHNQFGEVNQTLEWLRKALAAGYSRATVRDTPLLDNLCADPRFQKLLQEH